jgi:hypothetical protein
MISRDCAPSRATARREQNRQWGHQIMTTTQAQKTSRRLQSWCSCLDCIVPLVFRSRPPVKPQNRNPAGYLSKKPCQALDIYPQFRIIKILWNSFGLPRRIGGMKSPHPLPLSQLERGEPSAPAPCSGRGECCRPQKSGKIPSRPIDIYSVNLYNYSSSGSPHPDPLPAGEGTRTARRRSPHPTLSRVQARGPSSLLFDILKSRSRDKANSASASGRRDGPSPSPRGEGTGDPRLRVGLRCVSQIPHRNPLPEGEFGCRDILPARHCRLKAGLQRKPQRKAARHGVTRAAMERKAARSVRDSASYFWVQPCRSKEIDILFFPRSCHALMERHPPCDETGWPTRGRKTPKIDIKLQKSANSATTPYFVAGLSRLRF